VGVEDVYGWISGRGFVCWDILLLAYYIRSIFQLRTVQIIKLALVSCRGHAVV
jgi:hypothetical protein